eukprot:5543622-Pyramimonas_sp.AAC.1
MAPSVSRLATPASKRKRDAGSVVSDVKSECAKQQAAASKLSGGASEAKTRKAAAQDAVPQRAHGGPDLTKVPA